MFYITGTEYTGLNGHYRMVYHEGNFSITAKGYESYVTQTNSGNGRVYKHPNVWLKNKPESKLDFIDYSIRQYVLMAGRVEMFVNKAVIPEYAHDPKDGLRKNII